MTSIKILINKIADIKDFITQVNKSQYKIFAKSGHYVVDAKSILSIFSLDLSTPILIESEESIEPHIIKALEKYKAE